MEKSKLYTFLASFSGSMLERFELFLASPYYTEQRELLLLFRKLKAQLEKEVGLGSKQLSKQLVWKSLFEARVSYNDLAMRQLQTSLLQMAYRFVHAEASAGRPEEEWLSVMAATRAPHMEKHFRGVVRKMERQAEQPPTAHSFEYRYRFYLERHWQVEARSEKLQDAQFLEAADYFLEVGYHLRKLKHYCDAVGYEHFMAAPPKIYLREGYLDYLGGQPFLAEEPWLKAFYYTARMLTDQDGEPWFFELRELLFSNLGEFPAEDARALCIHLSNFCIDKKINTGEAAYFGELFTVYRRGIESELLLREGQLSYQDYKNIITVGLHIKAYDWVEQFIEGYTDRLPEEHRDNALAYNLAKVYFHQGAYGRVIEQLREVEYESLVYALGSKLLLLLTYYEAGEFLALDGLLDSFRIYLRRNRQISKEVRQQYLNVIRFTRRLSNLSPGDEKALLKIQKEVEACEALAGRQWLMEKIAGLKPVSAR
ncbi:hypothetical protein [Phaeodactylibacter luteus]|uniref:Uncharacterized protein n=1 Tax=Phaeodactylibacter luteus TaxID=1564516 RepID=A0A5C6RJC5_9BACT|nr:hypothetical protein [Phaeodactylibacter luteus]TXB62035.1 hypothetical protein FRY97_16260 [Phaeodactylibacter luteus]